jgi:DNA repair exonuclease SbcCD ATPase subunit
MHKECNYPASEHVCHCNRPDSQRWRPFEQLSGGQQALLSIALTLALQPTCSLPLYYFDEVWPPLETS